MNTMLLHLSHFVKCRSLLFSEYGFINVKATMFFFSKTLFLLISIQIMSDQEGDRRQTSFSRPPPPESLKSNIFTCHPLDQSLFV